MKPTLYRFMRRAWWLMLLVMIGAAVVGAVTAQDVQLTTAVTGTLAANGEQVAYSFNGTLNDLVTVRVAGLTPGMDPNLSLFGPNDQLLLTNETDPFFPTGNSALLVYRLAQSGEYTISVGGTAGDFLLTLDVRPAVVPVPLELDTPTTVTLPAQTPLQVFTFNTDPFAATTLLLDADPLHIDAFVEVRDASGEIVTTLRGEFDNACVSFAPGDEPHEVTISALPSAVGTITLTLGRGPCQMGAEPQPVTVDLTNFEPVPLENVCAASSPLNLNVRIGPSVAFPVQLLLLNRQPIQVIGQSEDGTWIAVQTPSVVGFVPASLVALVGPCDTLEVVVVDIQPPAATPTPGLPETTDEPDATEETTDAAPTAAETEPLDATPTLATPTVDATEPTAEPPAGATETPEMTPEVTLEVTMTATATATATATSTPTG